ncbi:MAG: hypothetical protein EOP09_20400, partial [Proteobacteria bacterium]
MAFLSWQTETIQLELKYEASGVGSAPSKLRISTPANLFEELRSELVNLGKREIRIDLPDSYCLFIKQKDSGLSRLLLAHPEENEWVATFMLSPGLLKAWLDHTANGATQVPFQFSGAGHKLDKFGNLEV